MPKETLQTRYARGLEALGYHELTATRYVGARAFRHPHRVNILVFLGNGGSVRAGQNRSTCHAVSQRFKDMVLEAAGALVERA